MKAIKTQEPEVSSTSRAAEVMEESSGLGEIPCVRVQDLGSGFGVLGLGFGFKVQGVRALAF